MNVIEFLPYLERQRFLASQEDRVTGQLCLATKQEQEAQHRVDAIKARAKADEVKVCQMLALLKERLGGVEIKPMLTVVGAGSKRKVSGSLKASSTHSSVVSS